MPTYIIGDVQGCFEPLQRLLKHIHFNPKKDRLGFVGDLVNRGPQSLETLRFIQQLNDPIVVLGNHDLYLLSLLYGIGDEPASEHLLPILSAPDKTELTDWLRQQKLAHYDVEQNYLLVHAGIPPVWSLQETLQYANEVETILQSEHANDYLDYLENMFGDQPETWDPKLTGWERLRYITNALTRIRFCDHKGSLDLKTKTSTSPDPNFKPWFDWRDPECDILYGHWAALEGKCQKPHHYALDTGCVYGGPLTALRIEDRQLFQIACKEKEKGNYDAS